MLDCNRGKPSKAVTAPDQRNVRITSHLKPISSLILAPEAHTMQVFLSAPWNMDGDEHVVILNYTCM